MTSANLAIALALLLVGGSAAAGPTSDFVVPETPTTLPAIGFTDGAGKQKTLAHYSGRLVLLNIWATWCAPCRKEMPTLDRLEAKLGGPDFEVVALSMDRKGPDAVKKFFAETGVTHLALNIDSSAQVMLTLGAPGLPMTLLIDGSGKEIGRLIGPAEWDSPQMTEFIRSRIAANREGK